MGACNIPSPLQHPKPSPIVESPKLWCQSETEFEFDPTFFCDHSFYSLQLMCGNTHLPKERRVLQKLRKLLRIGCVYADKDRF